MRSVRAAWFANVMLHVAVDGDDALVEALEELAEPVALLAEPAERLAEALAHLVDRHGEVADLVPERRSERLVERAGLDPRGGARDPPQPRRDQHRDEQADERADGDRDQGCVDDLVLDDAELAEQLGPLRVGDDRAVFAGSSSAITNDCPPSTVRT